MKTQFWDIIRPLHLPVTRTLRRILGSNYAEHPEMRLPPPYEAVQLEVERNLHKYLHTTTDGIKRVVIVGANNGDEVPRIRRSYPSCTFLCFEPSPRWFNELSVRFENQAHIQCRELALAEERGTAVFFELPMDGNGSLLEPDLERWAMATQSAGSGVESFNVRLSTLDEEVAGEELIDLLWVDVQGAEAGVLRGGKEALRRTQAIFLEVALVESPYKGALLYPGLNTILRDAGFTCVALGIDGWNYTGNALWVRDIESRLYKAL